jgi:transcriptional regulator with XRE-family HTH domain
VGRRRLAAELICLRNEHGFSAARVAKEIGVVRQRISRLENGHVVRAQLCGQPRLLPPQAFRPSIGHADTP